MKSNTRTPRAEGMDNMLTATVELLHRRTPDQITVREIAEASGHHHRFVQAWFGGKVGLFRAAFDRMTEQTAARVTGRPVSTGGFAPGTRSLVILMNWLVAADPQSLNGARPTPVVDRLAEVYRDIGLEVDVARLMALRFVAAATAAILFEGPFGLTDDDVSKLADLEFEFAELLARSRPRR